MRRDVHVLWLYVLVSVRRCDCIPKTVLLKKLSMHGSIVLQLIWATPSLHSPHRCYKIDCTVLHRSCLFSWNKPYLTLDHMHFNTEGANVYSIGISTQ